MCVGSAEEKKEISRKQQGHAVESGNVEKYEGEATRARGDGEERGHCGKE